MEKNIKKKKIEKKQTGSKKLNLHCFFPIVILLEYYVWLVYKPIEVIQFKIFKNKILLK